jgi:formylglycine-generating enzyme required for sulfatase activity
MSAAATACRDRDSRHLAFARDRAEFGTTARLAPALPSQRFMLKTSIELNVPAHAGVGMVCIPGGTFHMGSMDFYPEERPVRAVTVDAFLMDRYAVTNERFARFVDETGYVTVSERPLDPADFPGAPPENLVPGSMVFP